MRASKYMITMFVALLALLFAVPGHSFDGWDYSPSFDNWGHSPGFGSSWGSSPGFGGSYFSGNWESNPNNWSNSLQNWENSPANWKNSPGNWANSPYNWGNDRIIRDNAGRPRGYIVPRSHGGANIYDFRGERRAYIP